MKTSNLVVWLTSIIVALALVAASIGLFWQDGGNSFSFTTLRGDTVSIAGVMLLHRKPLGYLLSSMLLVFTVMLGTNLLAAGTIQMLTGSIDIGQFIGFVASFAILTLYAIWFALALFRNVSERTYSQDTHLLDVV
jgi:hypothetical protein